MMPIVILLCHVFSVGPVLHYVLFSGFNKKEKLPKKFITHVAFIPSLNHLTLK